MSELNNKKIIRAWSFYDWANSAYPLVITTAIFPLYYASLTSSRVDGVLYDKVEFWGLTFKNTEFYSYVMSFSYLIVSIISPFLSGVADYTGNKAFFLKTFCYLGALACFALFFFDVKYYELSMLFVLLGSIGFWASIVFYNSYLPDIATEDQFDKISAQGYSMGYLGSSLLLTMILILILSFDMGTRWSFPMVAIWWVGFAQITYKHLPKQVRKKEESSMRKFSKGFRELKRVFIETRKKNALRLFLWSFFIYSMGVQTVMVMATFFGEKEILWSSEKEKTTGLIFSTLLIQIIAIAGAYLHSELSNIFGNKKALCASLFLWVVVCVLAYFIVLPIHFYMVAALVGIIMGGIQSLSRSSYSKLISETKETTSYFSFYDVSEKIGLVIGTFSFGFLERITGSMRGSVVLISCFFFVGLLIMYFVPSRSFNNESTE